ncbi:hypothetical protein HAX54_051010 [Datura stramonium]|uniref:Pentatricopeptide repeat-containing protein n=1 Tax=Datura stramonium TaxID=4076 RepID=A0ABS8RTC1_DATST|nr:hypothetical protein [Datura stramonium]
MKQKGIPPNTVTYNSLIDELCQELGQWGMVRTMFSEMVELNIYPNVLTFNIVIDGLCKKEVKDAEEVMKHMVGKYGLVEEAMLLFNKLERKREDTDIEFYNVVINGLCRNGKLHEARAVFEKVSLIGLLPNVRTYNNMINGFCLGGLLDEAKDMIRKMENNCFQNDFTFNVIVGGYLRCRKINEMATFMKEMTGKGFSFDAATTALLVKAISENPSILDMIPELHVENKK